MVMLIPFSQDKLLYIFLFMNGRRVRYLTHVVGNQFILKHFIWNTCLLINVSCLNATAPMSIFFSPGDKTAIH